MKEKFDVYRNKNFFLPYLRPGQQTFWCVFVPLVMAIGAIVTVHLL